MMALLPWLVLLLISSGCVSNQKNPHPAAKPLPRVPSAIDQINVLAVPIALDFNNIPGPDGFVITVYGGSADYPKAIPIERGTIEILMFDGLMPENGNTIPAPLKTWKIPAQDLKQYLSTTSIGTGYQIPSLWGEAAPKAGKISVMVRYTSSNGAIIYSAPSIIAVPAK